MNPVNINLATFQYYDKRVSYVALVIIALFLAGITFSNLNQGIQLRKEIGSYNKKIERLERQLSKRKQTREKIIKKLKGEEMQAIREGAKLVNRIITKDVLPWDKLLDAIEMDMPEGMILTDIKVADDFSRLILSGFTEAPKKIAKFMKNLKKYGFFEKNHVARLSVGEELDAHPKLKREGVFFVVESSLILEKLFDEKEYGHFLADIREAFTTK